MTGLRTVVEHARRGASHDRIAIDLGIAPDLAAAMVAEGVRLGLLGLAPRSCGACPTTASLACAGCPVAVKIPRT